MSAGQLGNPPDEPGECYDPYADAERAMQLDESNGSLLGGCGMDRHGEHEDGRDKEQRQPVQEPDRRVEDPQFRITVGAQHPIPSVA